ncbi:MAG: TraR/DksA family transcriptional regulator [Methanothrix sp.]|nr:TraR/DksA family transcriptional regulator [Methanothrix sp.]
MGDPVDQAQNLDLMFQEQTRQRVLANATRYRPTVPISGRDCADCGDPIPLDRLRARPGATLCIDCQERKERRERQ